jgi:hypothetical protein
MEDAVHVYSEKEEWIENGETLEKQKSMITQNV